MELYKVLAVMYPNSLYVLRGDDYDGLEWMDESPKPTKAKLKSDAIEAESLVIQREQATLEAKSSAIDKLKALGLTIDEVEAAFGLTK